MKKTRKTEAGRVKMPRKTDEILGVGITGTNKRELLTLASKVIKTRGKMTIATPNPEIVVAAGRDGSLMMALNASDVAIPDGVGLLWALKVQSAKCKVKNFKLQIKNYERIPGRELMVEFFKMSGDTRLKVYLLGGSEDVSEKALTRARREFPGAIFAGESGGGVTKKGIALKKDIVDKINKFTPDFLFVAFGAPKQEKWVRKNRDKLNARVIMTVGGALDYFAGTRPLPPRLVSRAGLEWLWRLFTKPGHVKRVFAAVIVFPLLVLKERLT